MICLPLICGIFCGLCSDYLSWGTENANPAILKRLSQASLNEPGVKTLKSCGYFYDSFLLFIAMRHRATEGRQRFNAKLKTIKCAFLSEHTGSIHLQIQNERTEMAELTFPYPCSGNIISTLDLTSFYLFLFYILTTVSPSSFLPSFSPPPLSFHP